MPKYKFSKIETVEDLLEAIGRRDIPSTEVSLAKSGDDIEIDFGAHILPAADEAKLKILIAQQGMRLLGKE